MFQKILVAIDNSEASRTVFSQALDLARSMQANLMILHVLTTYDDQSPNLPLVPYATSYMPLDDEVWNTYRHQWEQYRKEGLERLQSLVAQASEVGVTAEFSQVSGIPAQTICSTADSWGADLIVTGSHGRTGLGELVMGSVSNYVMHHAPCAVMVCRFTGAE